MNTATLESFVETIRWMYEPEYGDFKRKVGSYLERLIEANPNLLAGANTKQLIEMKKLTVFDPDGDIESTRRKILELANNLNRI